MRILNRHERYFPGNTDSAGQLIDRLASPNDSLWPVKSWPPMLFDRELVAGAEGGHGPIRYRIQQYQPGSFIQFQFTGPGGFIGFHYFRITSGKSDVVKLEHVIDMKTRGMAVITWPLIFRPLHDALIEDALSTAQKSLGINPDIRPWSRQVKLLRWIISGGKGRRQKI